MKAAPEVPAICPRCRGALRFFAEHGWGCDRCQAIVEPVRATVASPAAAARRARRWPVALALTTFAGGATVVISPRSRSGGTRISFGTTSRTHADRDVAGEREHVEVARLRDVATEAALRQRRDPTALVEAPVGAPSVPTGWVRFHHEATAANVAFPAAPETANEDTSDVTLIHDAILAAGPTGGVFRMVVVLTPPLSVAEVDEYFAGVGGTALAVEGLPARQVSRRELIDGHEVPVEEIYVLEGPSGRLVRLATAGATAEATRAFFGSFHLGASPYPPVSSTPAGPPGSADDEYARQARAVIARHADASGVCRTELAAVGAHDPALDSAALAKQAAWAVTKCSQDCEDGVADSCALLRDLARTRYLRRTCEERRVHCIDICASPPPDAPATELICAAMRATVSDHREKSR